MKERPILFSAPMVRAIRRDVDPKTQTRRIINRLAGFGPITEFGPSDTAGYDWHFRDKAMRWHDIDHARLLQCCPYGQPGDRLWVKEKHAYLDVRKSHFPGNWILDLEYSDGAVRQDVYVDGSSPKQTRERGETGWRPSIHMHRWASRINLETTGVRVERFRDISEADCYAEGIQIPCDTDGHPLLCLTGKFPTSRYIENPRKVTSRDLARAEYASLIESINGAGTWDANPWVWVLEFPRVK